ncbi:MAG TPA: apolipoprotein N-acyltransferase [Acidimicrobiales bacterium]|nr:apolipoprotein N-acyltransferase [Acidimicrobiales bacterium]
MRRLPLALAAGLLVALSVPPWGFWPLAFAGVALLAGAIDGQRARRRALLGLAFAIAHFGPTQFWVTEFHAIGFGLLLLVEGVYFAAAMAAVPADRSRLAALAALPAAYVLAEWLRGTVPFGGLPMGGLPLGQVTGPLAPSARLGGAYLLTGLGVVVGGALAGAVWGRWRTTAALLSVTVALVGIGHVAADGTPGDRLDVTVVQGGGPRGFRAVDSDPHDVLLAHLDVSEGVRRPVDLVLWPENTIDVPALDGSVEADALAAVAVETGATVVAGVTEDVGDDNFQNAAVAWDREGRIVDRYVKVHRVPFGEYVPLRGLLEPIVDLSVLPRDAVSGEGSGILRTPAGDFGAAISYEVFFGERARAAVNAGGQLLLVPTNAASFTTSQVPTQEIAAAQLRAWESGRHVVLSAPTGYGAFIDHEGRVLGRTTLGRAELLRGRPELRTGRTVYAAAGDLPVVAVAFLVLLLSRGRVGWSWRSRRGGGRSASASAPASSDPRR